MQDQQANPILSNRHPAELLARAEEHGYQAMKGRHETATWISTQANLTLTLLLAAAGGSLAYAIKWLQGPGQPVELAAAVLCAYLVVLAVGLVVRCLMVEPIPAIWNEPASWLYDPGRGFDELRRLELANLQVRLHMARARNERTAKSLNVVRLLAAASPVVYLVAYYSVTR